MKRLNFFNISLKFLTMFCLIFWININETGAIIGGFEAYPGQFRYQISLLANKNYICGGAIISNLHVLTAAHCLISDDDNMMQYKFSIVAGVVDVDDTSLRRVERDVVKMYFPAEYKFYDYSIPENSLPMTGDLAVLKLATELIFDFSTRLRKVSLPTEVYTDMFFENKELTLSSFGCNVATTIGNDLGVDLIYISRDGYKLKFAKLKHIHNQRCQSIHNIPIKDTHFCAQMDQHNSRRPEGVCKGDSGSPLVMNGETIIGILAEGPPNCDESSIPGVYTRITSYLSFIQKAMNDEKSPDIRVANYKSKKKFFGLFGKSVKLVDHKPSTS